MNIQDMKYSEVMELKKSLESEGIISGGNSLPSEQNQYYKIGENIFVRTVTHILIGRLIAVYPTELVIEDASWVADTGRYADSMKDFSNLSEVEPYPDGLPVIIGRGSIIDAHMTNQPLQRTQR